MTFYLGPVGKLVALPVDPDPGLDVSTVPQQVVHRSLNGTVTRDRMAAKRTWPLAFSYLTHDQAAYLEALDAGDVTGNLRILDPLRPNMLSAQVATGGARGRATTQFDATGTGTIAYTAITDPPADAPANGGLAWTRGDTAAVTLRAGRASQDTRVPFVTGQQVNFRVWARSTVALTAALTVEGFTDATTSAGTVATGTTTAIAVAPTWTSLVVSYTPSSAVVSGAPVLTVAAGQPTATVTVTGWVAALATVDPGYWTPGGGAPVVIAQDFKDVYPAPNALHNCRLTLLEV